MERLNPRQRFHLRTDPLLWLIPFFLSGVGILMITSTTSPTIFEHGGTPFIVGIRQGQWLLIALVVMFVTYSVPLRFWRKTSGFFWLVAYALTWATLVPGIGMAVGGAKRWINLGFVTVQPSELLYLMTSIHLAKLLNRAECSSGDLFVRDIVLVVIGAAPLLLQPDFGTLLLLFAIGMGMYVERYGWKRPLFCALIALLLLGAMIAFTPYRMRRVLAFLDPWHDPLGAGFQAIQGLIAFANGSVGGLGLGHGFQKLYYLPASYTDFIFAALGEELGLIGTLGVLFLFFFWSLRCRRVYGMLAVGYRTSLTWGLLLTVVLPLVINVSGVTKLMPLTGMPLPFVSYGGSSLVSMWARVGILLRLCKDASGGDGVDSA